MVPFAKEKEHFVPLSGDHNRRDSGGCYQKIAGVSLNVHGFSLELWNLSLRLMVQRICPSRAILEILTN